MFKIDPKGAVAPFATVSQKGLGHLCFRDDRFFVTAFASHEIYEVKLDGTVKRILGNGEPASSTAQARKRGCPTRTASPAIRGAAALCQRVRRRCGHFTAAAGDHP